MITHSKYEFEPSEMSTGKDKKKPFTDIVKQKKKLFLKNKKNTDIYELLKIWVKDKHITKMSIEEVIMVFLELRRRKVDYDTCFGKFKGDCIKLNREIKSFI